ncbi:LysR family transcriptional regulator [Sphingobium sp. SA2]|uniref:LysR family transcriptional regulator n=1 Tax=Sphingobium sp. SA2 TaxID=1524832 RepID=UPI0028BFEFFB|nr:LysR family transcriptional regulator [Sphingobium sp. SA2]MDT7533133.1 LysR family transcriptional regulator [Sphingobium sp. SA2]
MSTAAFQLNIRHLRGVVAIVSRGSMSAAAQAVNLSQPALTQGLAKLERQIGVALFDRSPNGMKPTAEGRILAYRAEAALGHLASVMREIGVSHPRSFSRPEYLVTATQLNAYLSFAEAGSFAGAMQAIGLSKAALHRAVRDLEQLVVVPLFERRARSIALTGAGRTVARGIRLAAGEINAGIAEIRPDRGSIGGQITVGAMPLSRAYVLPRAIAAFTRIAPYTRIDVVEGAYKELVEPLRDGIIDLIIGALRTPHAPPDLIHAPLFSDRLAIVAHAGHPLCGVEAPTLDDLARYPWIIGRADTPLRALWHSLFDGRDLPKAPIECGSVITIRGILRDSNFLTILSPDQVAAEIDRKVLAMIGEPLHDQVRTIGIITRALWRPTVVEQRFIEQVHLAAEAPRRYHDPI